MTTDLISKLNHYLEGDDIFRRIYEYSRQRFDAAPHLTAHNFEHARRDVINAIAIGEPEGADMHIVLCATALHDIGFLYGATGHTHGAVGAEKVAEFLREGNINLPQDQLDHIAACLRTHKGSMHGEQPESIEAKVVSDADLLEKFGPIGVYQGIRTFTEFNLDAAEIMRRLDREDLPMQTVTGQKLADPLRDFDRQFIQALQIAYQPYLPYQKEDK